jgi:SAM-dependent methyltransferase
VDDATTRALNTLNLAFYREHGAAFSAKRERPWRGWSKLLDWIPVAGRLRVLDVGCGNARFGRFLAQHRAPERYTGVDASEPLLTIALQDAPTDALCDFQLADFVTTPPERALPSGPFDLAVLFGVLHGVPGRERRRALLEAITERVIPGGLVVFTCWDFEKDPRLASRIVPWDRAPAELALDRRELGPEDHLLPWGEDGRVLRYAATVGPAERAWLMADLPVEVLAEFADDGPGRDLNRYTVLRVVARPTPGRTYGTYSGESR